MGNIDNDSCLNNIREAGRSCVVCGHSKAMHYPHSPMQEDGHTFAPADEEPIFVLRAQDVTAVQTVQYWVSLNPDLPDAKREEAYGWCGKALAWPKKKRAD